MDRSDHLEETAIERAIVGDGEGYRYLLEKYQTYAFSIAIGILRNEENAEEVVQDAFIRVFNNIAKFKKKGKFSTWLYRIVYNTCLTKLRGTRKMEVGSLEEPENYELDIPDNYANGFDNLVRDDKIAFVNKAIASLSEAENLVVTLYQRMFDYGDRADYGVEQRYDQNKAVQGKAEFIHGTFQVIGK